MGVTYRDAIRKQGKTAKDKSVQRAVARSAADARAKVRQKHAGVARKTNSGMAAQQAPTQLRMF